MTIIDSHKANPTSLMNAVSCSELESLLMRATPAFKEIFAPLPAHNLQASMETRAMKLEHEFGEMSKNIHYSIIMLGWTLVQASLFEYHKYVPGYQAGDTLKDWVCRKTRIAPTFYDLAWELGKAWEFLKESNVPLEIILDERLTLRKARYINQLQRDSGRQQKSIAERIAGERTDLDTSEVKELARQQFLADVNAEVRHAVINLSDHDFDVETRRVMGEKERPVFYLHLDYHEGKISGTVSCLAGPEEIETFMGGKYAFAWCIKGEDGTFSPRQVGERFYEIAAAEED